MVNIRFYQNLNPKHLLNEVLRSLHGEFQKHPQFTKTIIAYREKKYNPNMAQMIKEWVISVELCIKESGIDESFTSPTS